MFASMHQNSQKSYSKATSYMALSYTDHAIARFLIALKIFWDTRIYGVKTLSCTFFDDLSLALLSNKNCMNFELRIFPGPKKRASQGLTVAQKNYFCLNLF